LERSDDYQMANCQIVRGGNGQPLLNIMNEVIANGQRVPASVPCTLEAFLVGQKLLPRSVVVEHNGEAVAPSEFPGRQINAGDRLEIVRIVAGG
jgi:thiamine biosynthesis protein ThiS